MKTSRQILIALFIKHNGDWDKIYSDIYNKEIVPAKYFKKVRRIENHFITLIDEDYPEPLKHTYKPPFVIKKER